MVNFKIEIADIVVEINAFNETTLKYCSDFLTDKESNYVITMTKEDLENEKHINEDGKVYANEEISALYRKIADIFVEIGRCLNMTFVNSLKAAGAYIFPLIAGILSNWGLGLSTGYFLGVFAGIGVAGIYLGTATDECIRGLIVMYYWYKKKWFGKSVVEKKDKLLLEEESS